MTHDPDAQYQTDHDLLVTLNERMSNLIKALDGVVASNKILSDDHETRLRTLEQQSEAQASSARTWRYGLSIAMTILGLLIGLIGLTL